MYRCMTQLTVGSEDARLLAVQRPARTAADLRGGTGERLEGRQYEHAVVEKRLGLDCSDPAHGVSVRTGEHVTSAAARTK